MISLYITCASDILASNFNPTVVYIDEAAQITELKNLIPFGLYSPVAYILAADYKQIYPTVQSVGRYLDKERSFTNPFQHQILLSLFERLISAGVQYRMLTV